MHLGYHWCEIGIARIGMEAESVETLHTMGCDSGEKAVLHVWGYRMALVFKRVGDVYGGEDADSRLRLSWS